VENVPSISPHTLMAYRLIKQSNLKWIYPVYKYL
jgi:hypothetical protein